MSSCETTFTVSMPLPNARGTCEALREDAVCLWGSCSRQLVEGALKAVRQHLHAGCASWGLELAVVRSEACILQRCG